ncbi:MAG: hypothetical protein H6550_16240 [Chitinophagales bacterium]|nr:hypothetical protein [Chitinophagales bacterium]
MQKLRIWARVGAYVEFEVPDNFTVDQAENGLHQHMHMLAERINGKIPGIEIDGETYTPDACTGMELTVDVGGKTSVIETPEYVYPTGFFNDDFTEFTNITVPVDSPNRKGKVVKSDLLEVNGVLSRGYVVQFRDHSQGYTDLLTKSRLVEVLLNTSHTFLVTKKQPYLNITKSDYVVFECRLPGVTSCRIGVSIKVSQAIDATESKTYEAAFEIVLQAVRYRIYESLPDLVVPSELTIRNDY